MHCLHLRVPFFTALSMRLLGNSLMPPRCGHDVHVYSFVLRGSYPSFLQGSHKYGRSSVIRCFFWLGLILSHRRKAVHLMHATPSCAFCFSCCLHVRQSHVAFSASDFGNWVWCTATLGSWHTLFLQAGSLQVLHVLHFGFEHCGLEQLSQCGVSLLLACRLRIMNVKWELRCSLHTVQG